MDGEITNPRTPRFRRHAPLLVAAVLALAPALAGCSGADPVAGPPGTPGTTTARPPSTAAATTAAPSPSPSPTRRATTARPDPGPPLVVLISVDGLNPDAITQLGARGQVPAFRRLISQGASTLNARSAYEQTNTLPNHTGMLTGRRITGPLGSNVTFNEDRPGTLASINGRYVPGIFDPVHDAGLGTAFFAEKDKFAFLLRSWDAAHGATDHRGPDDGRDKVDASRIGPAATLTRDTLAQLRLASGNRQGRPSLVFLHVAAPDLAGHAHGFMSARYLDAVRKADIEIGTVLDTISASASLRTRTTVVVTADHGGKGASHRDATKPYNYRIPFLIWGSRVPAGRDLYAINPGRRDPGTARVGYAGPQPIRNLDAADLVLRLLGLPPLPGTTRPGLQPLRSR